MVVPVLARPFFHIAQVVARVRVQAVGALLGATATDAEGDTLTYAWALTTSPAGSQLQVNATTAELSIAPDQVGTYTFSVTVSDGELEGSASADLEALPPPTIDGEVRVQVVKATDGSAIAGAIVTVEGTALTATTDATGVATITDATLVGPITLGVSDPTTVAVDHDLRTTTADIQRPALRGATLQGINRPDVVVPLKDSGSTLQAKARGVVRGTIDFSLFDRMPNIDPFLSFDMNETTSSQIRAVLIAPVVEGDASDFGVRDLLGRPPTLAAPLPGNLTTDDLFLNGAAGLLGVPVTGPDPLMDFTVDAPAGRTRFFVLGVLIDIDAMAVVPLLSGGAADSAALFGSMAFTTLFVGTLDLDVAAGDNDLLAPIADTDLTMLAEVATTITFQDSTEPWALNPTSQVALRRALVSADVTATLTAPSLLADPRVAASLPTSARVEIMDASGNPKVPREFTDLEVPAQTGAPTTEVPYSLAVAVVHDEAGMLPIGFTFTRVADLERPSAIFPLPTFTGALATAPIEALVLTTRGMWPSAVDGAYELLPGLHTGRVPLSAAGTVAARTPRAFPTLDSAFDSGVRVRVKVERADTSGTVVDSSRAYLAFLEEPLPTLTLDGPVTPTLGADSGTLSHLTLSQRTWTQVDDGRGGLNWTPVDDALWDVYATAGAAPIALPESLPFASGDEILLRVRSEVFPSPLDLDLWSGDRLRDGPSETTSDAFLYFMP